MYKNFVQTNDIVSYCILLLVIVRVIPIQVASVTCYFAFRLARATKIRGC
jgi:hypothetical protein